MAHNLALTIKPRSLATVDEGSAVDAIQEAADAASICRDISLLHNVINQLAVESQSLLNTFQLYLRANQSASATTATPVSASSVSTAKDSAISTTSPTSRPLNTLSTISSCTGTLTGSQKLRVDNVTATSALALSDPPTLPVLQATLREQWDAIKLLCYTLDGTVGSYQSEISPYVFAMGSIIDALTGLSASPTQQQPQQQPQPLKPMAAGASEYNLPFYSLKLLSAIKSAVAVEVDLLERVVTEEQMKAATSVVDGASVALQNRLAKLMRRRGEVGASGGPGGLLGVDDADASPRNRTAGGGDDDDELARSMDDFEGSTPSSQGTGGSASAVSASPAMLALPGSAASFRIRSVSDGVKPSEEQALHPHDRDRLLSVAPEGDAGEKHDTVGGPTLAATGGAGVDGAGIRYTVRSIARQIVVVTARPPAPGASLRDARRGFLTQVSGQPASLPAISSTANSPTAMTSPTSAAAAGDTGSPIRRSRSLTSTNRDRVSSIRASRADGAAWGRATPSPTGGVSGSPSVSQNANTFNGGGGGSPFLAGGGGSASMQRQTSSSAFGVVTSPPPMTLQALAGTLDALLPLTAAKEQQQQQHQQAQPQQARKPFMSPASHQPSPTSDASSATTIRKISPLSPGMRSVSATTQVVLIPINGMFELCTLDLKGPTSFGRSNTRKNINFKAFESQVVSRNHMEIWEDGGKVYIRDMGSNGGTYRNGSRLSPSGQASAPVEVQTGDYVQIGRDFLAQTEDGNIVKVSEDEIVNGLDPSLSFNLHWKNELPDGGVTVVDKKHRCIKFQILIVPSDVRSAEPLSPISVPQLPITLSTDASAAATHPPARNATQAPPPAALGHAPPLSLNPDSRTTTLRAKRPANETRLLIDTSVIRPLPSLFSAPPETSSYQKELEAKQREIERQLVEQHEKMKREISQLSRPAAAVAATSSPSLFFPSLESSSLPSAASTTPGIASPGLPSAVVEEDKRERAMMSRPRMKLNVSSVVQGARMRKLGFMMQGLELELFDINFKQWEAKRMLTVTDLRPRYFSTANVELEPSPADPNTFIVTGKSPMTQLPVTLGTIVKMSDIKLQVNPAESESGHSPRSKNAGSLYTLNGSLKDAKFIVIQRFTNSREQRLIGESFGRKLIRKSVRETRWSCEMDLEEDDEASIGAGVTECGQLLMSAIIFVHVLFNAN